jgi:hypothetical protein
MLGVDIGDVNIDNIFVTGYCDVGMLSITFIRNQWVTMLNAGGLNSSGFEIL